MAKTVDEFKKEIKKENLSLSENMAKNPYQDAIARSAECTKILTGKDVDAQAEKISIPNDPKNDPKDVVQ